LQDKDTTRALKTIRHSATDLVLKSRKISLAKLLSNRDVAGDKTKFIDFMPSSNIKISDIFMSNMERVKESFRVLEECFKIIDEKISRGYRKLRFDTYDIEKNIVKKAL
jgi:ThiD2 family